jgi:FlgD Ig-like domain
MKIQCYFQPLAVIPILVGTVLAFPSVSRSVPPPVPVLLQPADGQVTSSTNVTLTWTIPSPNGHAVFDVYFGTDPQPPLAAQDITDPQLILSTLPHGATYYWFVVAHNISGSTASATWSFTTPNASPWVTQLAPADSATAQPTTITFSWDGGDVDGNFDHFLFYLGTSDPPSYQFATTTKSFTTTILGDTQYYWRVAAQDNIGAITDSPVFTLFTRPSSPPNISYVSPSNGSINRPLSVTLSWQSSDLDLDPIRFDVYFGTGNTPPIVAHDVTLKTFAPYQALAITPSTTYYWRVVAKTLNGNTEGPLWSFVTKPNSPPSFAYSPRPPVNSFAPNPPSLSWMASDADEPAQTLRYDVYFGIEDPPPLVEAGRYAPNYQPSGPLDDGTLYYWSVTVSDGVDSTPGPVWYFFATDSVVSSVAGMPIVATLGHNHPNPFNPQTIIPYGVPASGAPVHVRLVIYDTMGREVRTLVDESQPGGFREVIWKGDDRRGARVASGVYFCVLQAGNERRTQKLVLLK